ncbi:MAG: rhomboid family intramembrane serine protease [Planctomycetota bacterium]
MQFEFPDERPVSIRSRWLRLSVSARLAIILGAFYVAQLSMYLFGLKDPSGHPSSDYLSYLLHLQSKPFSWQFFYQIFSYGLVHATTEPLHVTLNAVFLFFCGSLLEGSRGPRTMLLIFWAGVVAGGLTFTASQYLLSEPGAPLVGASAGVYAVLVAAAVSFPNLETLFRLPLWVFAALYVGIDFVLYILKIKDSSNRSPVAYVAHLGGALAGFVIAIRGVHDSPYSVPIRERIVGSIKDSARKSRERKAKAREAELDRILEKIHIEGMSALSDSEKRFLKEASSRIHDGDRAKTSNESSVGTRNDYL